MRLRVRRLLGVSALALLFGLPVVGCSGSGQEDEGLDVSGQDNNAAADDNSDGDKNASDNSTGDKATAGDDQAGDDATTQEEGSAGGDTAQAGDGSENDLQEIIQEMNGQPQQDTAAAPAAAPNQAAPAAQPAQEAAPAAAPATETAQAAPAPAQAQQPSSPLPFQPGGTPAGNGLPELGSKMAYVVEHGDTLGNISKKIYGSPNRWHELATLSGITNPSRIFPGDLVYYTLDEGAVRFATAYESIQKAEEKVKQGDTLATIAKRVYGSTTAWRSIWRQNDRIDNPDIVPPGGSVQYIPKGAATTAMLKAKVDLVQLAKTTHTNLFKSTRKISSKTKSRFEAKLAKAAKTNSILTKIILAKSQNIIGSTVKIANVSVVPVLI